MEEQVTENIHNVGRKRGKRNKALYKSEIIKKARVKGQFYTSYKGVQVNQLQPGPDCE